MSRASTVLMISAWILAMLLSALGLALFAGIGAEPHATGVFFPLYVLGWVKATLLAASVCAAIALFLRHWTGRPWLRFGPPLGNLSTTISMVFCTMMLLFWSHAPARLVGWQAARDCRLGTTSAAYKVMPACEVAARLTAAY